MFNAGNLDAGCSRERYRLTDVHQPTTAVVLSTAVPGWPCGRDSSERKERDEKEDMNALSSVDTVAIENISDSTVREVLKVIESVDSSIMYVMTSAIVLNINTYNGYNSAGIGGAESVVSSVLFFVCRRHRNGRVTGKDRPSEMTELMRLFEDRRTDIFLYDPNKPVKEPAGAFGDETACCFF